MKEKKVTSKVRKTLGRGMDITGKGVVDKTQEAIPVKLNFI